MYVEGFWFCWIWVFFCYVLVQGFSPPTFLFLWIIISIDSGNVPCIASESSETFGQSYLGKGALELAANCQHKSFELKGLVLQTGGNMKELTAHMGEARFNKAWVDAIEDHAHDECVSIMTLLFSQEQ